MKLSTAIMLVQRVVTGLPVEVYDDETEEIMSVPDYELCTPRPSGDCAGSRQIGSANMILLRQQTSLSVFPTFLVHQRQFSMLF